MSNENSVAIKKRHPDFYSPYDDHPSYLFAWKKSVLPRVIPQALLITAFSVLIVGLWKFTILKLGIKPNFIIIIAFVVSLLLAYRTNTAYDRYWEGRRLWSTMLLAIRNLSRFVWVNVPNMNKNEIDSEKFAILDLLAGFALATKHYLREEDGTDAIKVSLDMRPLETKEGADSKSRLNKILKLLLTYRSKSSPDRGLNEPEKVVNYNLPLEITLYLNHYISQLKRRVNEDLRPDDPSITQMYANVSILVDCLTNLERVLRSPIPFAYAVHLSQTTCIFCLSLPFQLVGDLEWVTVPIVFLASVILLGVEEIANEIENPFGTDPNDLKLDQFCELLGMELDFVRSHNKIKSQWEETAKRAKTSEFNESNELDIKKESKGEISVVTEK